MPVTSMDSIIASLQDAAILLSICRTLKKPYIRKTSTDELKLLGIVAGLLQVLARSLDRDMPEQLQACTAEVWQ
jgi:uncharacterized protein Yka (UPF0111/DUF47 family)